MRPIRLPGFLFFILIGSLAAMAGCGSSGSSGSANNESNGGSGNDGSVNNVATIAVNNGPLAGPPYNEPYVDAAFISVTLCVPGSTTNCQTIPNILVDTGSSGLRIFTSVAGGALTLSLPQQTDSSGNAIAECYPFEDSEVWGVVQTANVTIAGEQANSVPIQVINNSSFPSGAQDCQNTFGEGPLEDTVAGTSTEYGFGAYGVLGVSPAVQDCGEGCTVSGEENADQYYSCTASGTCSVIAYPLASQVPNPVSLFATDNNGVLVQLPSVSVTSPQTSVSGSLIFGIGTQSNNGLGSATVYNVDTTTDLFFNTTFQGVTYLDALQSGTVLDTGSNALYIAEASVFPGVYTCTDDSSFYCESSATPPSFSATNYGYSNGATGTVNFSIGDADALVLDNATAYAAVNGFAGGWGPAPLGWDWGLPFFFGRNVYVAMQGKSTPGGTGPYVAY